jgi:large subunit ribosomal protein L31
MQISSASHPFFTGEEKIIDTEGRVDRFKARAKKAAALKAQLGNKVAKAQKEAAKKAAKEDK